MRWIMDEKFLPSFFHADKNFVEIIMAHFSAEITSNFLNLLAAKQRR